jgi:hypothetical protein
MRSFESITLLVICAFAKEGMTQNLNNIIYLDAAQPTRVSSYFGHASPEQGSLMLVLSLVIQPLQDLRLVGMHFKGNLEASRACSEIFEQCIN